MKNWHWILILIALLGAGTAVWYFLIRKKTTTPTTQTPTQAAASGSPSQSAVTQTIQNQPSTPATLPSSSVLVNAYTTQVANQQAQDNYQAIQSAAQADSQPVTQNVPTQTPVFSGSQGLAYNLAEAEQKLVVAKQQFKMLYPDKDPDAIIQKYLNADPATCSQLANLPGYASLISAAKDVQIMQSMQKSASVGTLSTVAVQTANDYATKKAAADAVSPYYNIAINPSYSNADRIAALAQLGYTQDQAKQMIVTGAIIPRPAALVALYGM